MTTKPDRVDTWIDSWRAELPESVFASTELTERILSLSAGLDAAMRRALADFPLTPAEFDVLTALRRSGEPYRMKPNHLARLLMLSTGGTTNVAHRLVARGYVVREADPEDARSAWIHLTPEGIDVAGRAVVAVGEAVQTDLFEGVPTERVDQATQALRALSAEAPRPRQ
ncbi:MarR family winged helix-turn-helix transcriptional regulator [Streptomyces acidiscabies]|uniref:MarR family winged helix-turn-helix transcriptional regulator n=1 Tax=Streptomyces acidiscabies TaxID=42234 RepID=UPI0038F74DE9